MNTSGTVQVAGSTRYAKVSGSGTATTELAARCAPPPAPIKSTFQWLTGIIAVVAVVTVSLIVAAVFGFKYFIPAAFLHGVPLYLIYRKVNAIHITHRKEYPESLRAWHDSWLCLTCGEGMLKR